METGMKGSYLEPNSTDEGLIREYEEKADLDLPQEVSLERIGGLGTLLTNTANHRSVSQADFSVRQSSHLSTPKVSSMHRPSMAATTLATPSFSPKIHRVTARSMVPIITHSLLVTGPISCGSGEKSINIEDADGL
jgi:hypothetical protein